MTLIALVWICLFGVARATTTDDLDPGHKWRTGQIVITGNHAFADSELLAILATKQRTFYEVWKPKPLLSPTRLPRTSIKSRVSIAFTASMTPAQSTNYR